MSGFRNIVIESPCKLSYKGGYMVVRKEDDTAKVHLSEFQTLVLHTNQVYISAYLLSELAKAKVSLVVSDERHDPVGQYLPLYGAHNTSGRIEEQLEWGPVAKKQVWQRVIKDKILHQSRVLGARAREEAAEQLERVAAEVRSGDSTNREAHAAHVYFRALFGPDFSRDDDTPINAALNYGYALLLSSVNREIVSRGYLTQEGICHHNEFNQFNLSCDLMEPTLPRMTSSCSLTCSTRPFRIGEGHTGWLRSSPCMSRTVSMPFPSACPLMLLSRLMSYERRGEVPVHEAYLLL